MTLELLERALGYTRGALVTIAPEHLTRETPCEGWRLSDLLAHMEDALDAFAEGAVGIVGRHATGPTLIEARVGALQTKACALLGLWASAPAGSPLPGLAAVEIALHGWDVACTTTGPAAAIDALPDSLAIDLLPVARQLVQLAPESFAEPVAVAADAPVVVRLLAAVGRRVVTTDQARSGRSA